MSTAFLTNAVGINFSLNSLVASLCPSMMLIPTKNAVRRAVVRMAWSRITFWTTILAENQSKMLKGNSKQSISLMTTLYGHILDLTLCLYPRISAPATYTTDSWYWEGQQFPKLRNVPMFSSHSLPFQGPRPKSIGRAKKINFEKLWWLWRRNGLSWVQQTVKRTCTMYILILFKPISLQSHHNFPKWGFFHSPKRSISWKQWGP